MGIVYSHQEQKEQINQEMSYWQDKEMYKQSDDDDYDWHDHWVKYELTSTLGNTGTVASPGSASILWHSLHTQETQHTWGVWFGI